MKIKVVPNYYAPKIDGVLDEHRKIHCVVYSKCNFRCIFCDFWQRDDIVFKEISVDNFRKVVEYLLSDSKAFKFTGGEPCMNPNLKEMLSIVKEYGGTVFLDTNASLTQKVKELVDEGLVDILGISLKGISANEAKINSGIGNEKICWDNVLDTIKYAALKKVKIVVTRVVYNKIDRSELLDFADLLSSLGDTILLKINNLMVCDYNTNLNPIKEDLAKREIEKLINNRPEYKGRIIYINDKSAVYSEDKIQHF